MVCWGVDMLAFEVHSFVVLDQALRFGHFSIIVRNKARPIVPAIRIIGDVKCLLSAERTEPNRLPLEQSDTFDHYLQVTQESHECSELVQTRTQSCLTYQT